MVDVAPGGVVAQFHEVDFFAIMASCVWFMWACRPLPGKKDDAKKSGELPKDSTAWTWDSLSVEQKEKVKNHAGWATNRVCEDTAASRQDRVFTVSLSSSDCTPTSCTRGIC